MMSSVYKIFVLCSLILLAGCLTKSHFPLELGKLDITSEKVSSHIYFAANSAELREQDFDIVERQIEWLEQHPDNFIVIIGFADNDYNMDAGFALGYQRAIAVKKYLVDNGISKLRVTVSSFGSKYKCSSSLCKEKGGRAIIVPQVRGLF